MSESSSEHAAMMKQCKVCRVWTQLENEATGCCPGCENDPRKLHGHIYDLEQAIGTLMETTAALRDSRNEAREQVEVLQRDNRHLDDAVTLVLRLARYVHSAEVHRQAMDWLERNGFHGSPLK